jgi:hypothetical protein
VQDHLSTESGNSPSQASQNFEISEFIGHPLYSNCTAPSEFRPPPEQSKCRRSLTLCVCKAIESGFRKRLSPLATVNLDHRSLFASDSGHITYPFRRFCGGGSSRNPQTNGSEIYSKISHLVGHGRRSDLQVMTGFGSLGLHVLRPIRFDCHDTALPTSKFQEHMELPCRTTRVVRINSCAWISVRY